MHKIEILKRDRIPAAATGGKIDHDIIALLACRKVRETRNAGKTREMHLVNAALEVLGRIGPLAVAVAKGAYLAE
ncbi:MAG: hypothetical protein OXC93_04505 [Rhodospirillaceae bacterium]|nr:hypothetical protein [Rhodospirillaceae bacterium]